MSDDLRELLGAYALDAVDDDERRQVDQLLAIDPRARAEVAEHREVATLLSYTGAPAPAGLWDRIAASLEEPAPPPRLAIVGRDEPVVLRPSAASSRRRGFGRIGVGAVAAAAAVVIGVLSVRVVDQGRRLDDFERTAGAPTLTETAAFALSDPNALKVDLTSEDGAVRVPAAVETNGLGYLVAHDLPALPDDKTYQLWGVVEGRVISLGVLGADPKVVAFSVEGELTALVITEEVRGGVPVSEQPAALSGVIT
jgi:hypothetical protein